ncbi:MAG: MFS transporter, partial [Mesorhizobium sp.]
LPIAFGALNDLTGVWSSCFMLLFVIVVGCLAWMHLSIRRMERASMAETPALSYAAE